MTMKIFWKTNLTKLVSMKRHLFRFLQMVQPGIVNNSVMRRGWRWLEKLKSLQLCCNIKTFSLQLVFRHQHQLRLPLSHALIAAHISISCYLVIFSKTLSPKIFSSYYLSLPRTIKWQPRSCQCWPFPLICCRGIPNWGGVFAKSRVAVEGQVECWLARKYDDDDGDDDDVKNSKTLLKYVFWQTPLL